MKKLKFILAMLPLFVACATPATTDSEAEVETVATPEATTSETTDSVEVESSNVDRFLGAAKEALSAGGEVISEKAGEALERGGEVYDKMKVKGGEVYDKAKVEVGEAVDVVREKGGEVYDKVKVKGAEVYDKAVEEGTEIYHRVRDNVCDNGEEVTTEVATE